MKDKTPSFSHSISFQLAKLGIVFAFVLSFLMSSLQVYIDYQSQLKSLQQLIERVAEVATPPAARAVHTLDTALASEVATGLLHYDFIYEVEILDERSNQLAYSSRPRNANEKRFWTFLTPKDTHTYAGRLRVLGYAEADTGELRFSVDLHTALADFYERSEIGLVVGISRNFLLVFILFVAFYFVLTKPLVRLANEIKAIDPDQPGVQRLTSLPPRRRDELATLVTSSNQLLDVVELSLAKRRAVELALRKSEGHLRQIIDSLPVMIGARNREGFYLFVNQSLAELLGYDQQQISNIHVRQLLKNSVQNIDEILAKDRQVIDAGKEIELIEESFISADGSQLFLQTHMMPLNYYDQVVSLVVSMDITERKHAQAKMEYMAHHDALTRLPNRVQLVERLNNEIHRAQRHGYFGAVLFIDLDKFKNINDSLGHPVGDKVLQEVAERLVQGVRDEDMVSRLSGDEFVVVLSVLDPDREVAALRAGEISEKLRAVVCSPIYQGKMELRITCSVGVVVFPEKDHGVHELLRYADTAMYQVKEKGRDAIEFFNEDMADKVSRQLVMEGDLHRALEKNQFELYLQPKVDALSGRMIGAEALLRWNHPEKGVVSPVEFIPVLEASGLIVEVGDWVVEQACQYLERWQEMEIWRPDMRLSVNISPRQFRRDLFASDVIATLERYQVPPHSLDMEVTEGIVIQRVDEAIATMSRLISHGISFSLDDFGTGYSSISYLKRLPVAALKIDKSFVRDIIDDYSDRILVETIATMGRLLDLEVIAEGVEEKQQLDLLREYGCHSCQGFYFSRPLSLGAFEMLLRSAASDDSDNLG